MSSHPLLVSHFRTHAVIRGSNNARADLVTDEAQSCSWLSRASRCFVMISRNRPEYLLVLYHESKN